MPQLTIIRGVPGTGKSTKAKELANHEMFGAVRIEADMYFTSNTGQYDFDSQKLRSGVLLPVKCCYGKIIM